MPLELWELRNRQLKKLNFIIFFLLSHTEHLTNIAYQLKQLYTYLTHRMTSHHCSPFQAICLQTGKSGGLATCSSAKFCHWSTSHCFLVSVTISQDKLLMWKGNVSLRKDFIWYNTNILLFRGCHHSNPLIPCVSPGVFISYLTPEYQRDSKPRLVKKVGPLVMALHARRLKEN